MGAQLTCLTERLRVFFFLSHVKFTCGGPILGIFCLLLCSFPPFLRWIFFSCFHLPCSGNNKADFYLYAQMLGRSNLVGLLYISLPSLFLLSSLSSMFEHVSLNRYSFTANGIYRALSSSDEVSPMSFRNPCLVFIHFKLVLLGSEM